MLRKKIRKQSLRLKFALLLATVIILPIIFGLLVYLIQRNIAATFEEIRNTENLRSLYETLLRQSREIETTASGFIITGDKSYLELYEKSIGNFSEGMSQIKNFSNLRPDSLVTMNKATEFAIQWLHELRYAMEQRVKKGNPEYAQATLYSAATNALRDSLLLNLSRLTEGEKYRIKLLSDRLNYQHRDFYIVIFTGSLILFIFLLSAGYFLTSTIRRNIRIISEASRSLLKRDLNSKIPLDRRDELSFLAILLNRLASRIRISEANHRRSVEQIFDLVPSPVVVIHQDFSPLRVNLAFEKLCRDIGNYLEENPQLIYGDIFDSICKELRQNRKTGNINPRENLNDIVLQYSASKVKNRNNSHYYIVAIQDISDQRKAAEMLEASAAKYRSIVEDQTEFILRFDREGRIRYVNDVFCRYQNISRENLIGEYFSLFSFPDDLAKLKESMNSLTPLSPLSELTFRTKLPGNEIRWIFFSFRGIFKNDTELIEVQAVGRDVTNLVNAENSLKQKSEQLEKTVQEKEYLLKELHHRVKNNLQIMISIVRSQIRLSDQKEASFLLKEFENRLYSLAIVHEKLFQNQQGEVQLSDYLNDLLQHIDKTFLSSGIRIQRKLEHYSVNIETAIPVGLIINEAVSNAIKYACPNAANCQISVEMAVSTANKCRITIRDNGLGYQPTLQGSRRGLGMYLIDRLSRQLNATVSWEIDQGTIFTLEFSELHYNTRLRKDPDTSFMPIELTG